MFRMRKAFEKLCFELGFESELVRLSSEVVRFMAAHMEGYLLESMLVFLFLRRRPSLFSDSDAVLKPLKPPGDGECDLVFESLDSLRLKLRSLIVLHVVLIADTVLKRRGGGGGGMRFLCGVGVSSIRSSPSLHDSTELMLMSPIVETELTEARLPFWRKLLLGVIISLNGLPAKAEAVARIKPLSVCIDV